MFNTFLSTAELKLMSTAITTSIVINFKAEAGSILKAELDDRATSDGGFNGCLLYTSPSPRDS